MDKYGPTFRTIRKNKNISQKEVYTQIVSRSFYQKFEKGEYTISVNNFEKLLYRINIDYEEFKFIHHEYKLVPYDQYLVDIFEAYRNFDYKQLNSLSNSLRFSSIQREIFLSRVAILLKNNILSVKIKSDEEHLVYDYLDKIETWTSFEIKLFNNMMNLIPYNKRKIYFEKSRSFSRKNMSLALVNVEISNWQSYIYLNHIQLLLYEDYFNEASSVLLEMENDKNLYFTNERTELAFLFLTDLIKLYIPEEREITLANIEQVVQLVTLLNSSNGIVYRQIKIDHEQRSNTYM